MGMVFAQESIENLFQPAQNFQKLGDIVSVVVQNAFVLAGVLAFALLVFAGFGMITAAGSGDTKKMESGKKAISAAVIGLILIISSFWIIQVLETLTGLQGKIFPK